MRVLCTRNMECHERFGSRRLSKSRSRQRSECFALCFHDINLLSGPMVDQHHWLPMDFGLREHWIPLYAAGLYVNNRTGATWFVYFGSIACGISAGFFWSVEGAISTGYPESTKRGRYIATWFTFRNFGNVVGGSISLALNVNRAESGSVGYQTYLAFIAIQCLGFFIGSLLSNPEKVQRKDGTKIAAPKGTNWRVELREMWRLARSRSILLLVPLFWYYGWCQAYPGTYLATYFTVRSRALGSLCFAFSGTFGTWLAGALADVPWNKSRQTRAIVTYVIIASLNSGSWIWAVYIQNEFRHTKPTLDWADQSTFGRGFGLYVFERVSVSMVGLRSPSTLVHFKIIC